MKKLMLISLLTCSLTGVAFAETTHHPYVEFRWMGAVPMAGFGYRAKNDQNGIDFSAAFRTFHLHRHIVFHAKGQYLYYPIPTNGFYTGVGLGCLTEESIHGVTGSFEPSLGYNWKHIFIEANAIIPFKKPDGTIRVWPGVSVGVGF